MISPPAILARRFVAGETAEEAVGAGRRLHDRGIKATFDLLGEDVLDEDAARQARPRAIDVAHDLVAQ